MSKKIIYVRIIVITICLIFLGSIIFVIVGIQKSITESNILEETTSSIEEKIVFELWKAPYEQKQKLKGHEAEYEDQLYHYLFNDEKMINTAKISPVSSYDAIIGFGDAKDIANIYSKEPLKNLISIIFSDEDIDYSKYAFTENYIKNHPISLKKEFNQYFKENYTKPGKGKMYDMNYEYDYSYGYNIGCDRENQFAVVDVTKYICYVCEDGTSGSLWGKKGSKYEGQELYAELRTIYFKYKLDEKGYLDDIWFDHVEIIADEKDLDDSVNFWEE